MKEGKTWQQIYEEAIQNSVYAPPPQQSGLLAEMEVTISDGTFTESALINVHGGFARAAFPGSREEPADQKGWTITRLTCNGVDVSNVEAFMSLAESHVEENC